MPRTKNKLTEISYHYLIKSLWNEKEESLLYVIDLNEHMMKLRELSCQYTQNLEILLFRFQQQTNNAAYMIWAFQNFYF